MGNGGPYLHTQCRLAMASVCSCRLDCWFEGGRVGGGGKKTVPRSIQPNSPARRARARARCIAVPPILAAKVKKISTI